MRLIDADALIPVTLTDGGYWTKEVYYKTDVDAAPTIYPPSNAPLTLEELREMDGEPVFIIPTRGSGGFCTWMLGDTKYDLCREVHGEMAVFENCGKTWLAYRRRQEEAEHNV